MSWLSHPGLRVTSLSASSNEGARLLEVVHSESDLGLPADGAQVNQAHHVDARVSEFLRESRERPGLVFESYDEHGSARTDVAALHQRLAGLDRLTHDKADVGAPGRGL